MTSRSLGGLPLLSIVLICLFVAPFRLIAAWRVNEANGFQDFGIFYRAARCLDAGCSLYPVEERVAPNLAPPHVIAGLQPLGRLPIRVAYAVWLVITAVALTWSTYRIVSEIGSRWRLGIVATACAVAASSGLAMSAVTSGNIYAVLTAPMVEAWIAWRRGHVTRAAGWLGIVASAKVLMFAPLVRFAVRRQWRPAFALLGVASLVALFGFIAAGSRAYVEWLTILRRAPMSGQFHDAAFLQALLRVTSDTVQYEPLIHAPTYVVHLIWAIAAGLMLSLTAITDRSPDRTVLAVLSSAVFLAPIGWILAAWWLLGPALAVAESSGRAARVGLICCAVILWLPDVAPLWGQPSGWLAITWGSVNAWIVLAAWCLAIGTGRDDTLAAVVTARPRNTKTRRFDAGVT